MRMRTVCGPITAFVVGAMIAAMAIAPSDRHAPPDGPDRAGAREVGAPDARAAATAAASTPGSGRPAAGPGAAADAADTAERLAARARRDPGGFIAMLGSLEPLAQAVVADSGGRALRLASEADPRLMLTVGERVARPLHRPVMSAALEALAAVQPQAAVAYLSGIEPGDEREAYLAAVAAGFARADVDAAVDWLATLDEDDGAAFYPVIREVASMDLMRAIELDEWAMALDYGGPGFGDTEWFFRSLAAGRENPVRIAGRLIDSPSQGLLASVLEQWALDDPYGPIAWIQSQQAVSSLVVAGVAGTLAERDFRTALSYADQMSGRIRAIWLEAVFEAAAFVDARSALALLEGYGNESFYAETVDAIIWRASSTLGPKRAAALAGPMPSESLATRLGQGWARFEPASAMGWAMSLSDEATRLSVAQSVLRAWAFNDGVAASAWVDSLNDPVLRTRLRDVVCRVPNAVCGARL